MQEIKDLFEYLDFMDYTTKGIESVNLFIKGNKKVLTLIFKNGGLSFQNTDNEGWELKND